MDASVIAALREVLGSAGLLMDPTRRLPYESDGLAIFKEMPEVVLLPRDTRETARALAILHEARVPIVPRGAGTGLSGGATPVQGCAVIGTARMRDVIELNAQNRFARVQAGVVNHDLSQAALPHGLYYAPDPSSQRACTLGGNVAENSGGPHCFKHGSTTQHVLGLVIVTVDGRVIDLSAPAIDPLGYDLVGLFVGSEGMFGIATEITVKLSPMPAAVETVLAIFTDLDAACESVTDIIAARLEPSALEILDRLTIRAVEESVLRAGYPPDAEAVLLIEVEGSEIEVDVTTRKILPILERRRVLEVRRGRDPAERAKLWAGRKGAFGAMGRVAPDLYVADVVVPRTRLAELVRLATRICHERKLKVANVFHAGDGNLHPNICYDRRDADETARVLEAGDLIMKACIEAGGSLTGEHGVGLEKLQAMEWLFNDDDLGAMCRARDAWDPTRSMNPGKLVPVRACMETRASSRPRKV